MTPDPLFSSRWRAAAIWLPLPAAVAGALLLLHVQRAPRGVAPASVPVPVRSAAADPAGPAGIDWARIRAERGEAPPAAGALAQRFRLAGTFFTLEDDGSETRKAVLDAGAGGQHIVGEGGAVEDVVVACILRDRVVLRQGGEEAELWLGFTAAAGGPGADGAGVGEGPFGREQTGERSWAFSREALQAYYRDVLNDPGRLLAMFDAMQPLRGDDGRIEGYRLQMGSERDLYTAAGLRDGDVVRKVNGMRMTSRRRAEYFIGEFARDRSNAFVLDIERDGDPMKMVYQVR